MFFTSCRTWNFTVFDIIFKNKFLNENVIWNTELYITENRVQNRISDYEKNLYEICPILKSYSSSATLVAKALLNQNDFRTLFESILFSTRIIITHKDELFELVNFLVDHGFLDIGLKYLEGSAKMFMGDERMELMLEKIRGKDENSLK